MFGRIARICLLAELVPVNSFLKCSSVRYVNRAPPQVEVESSQNDWRPVYKLPIIGWVSALSKIKLYQAGLTTIAIPAAYAVQSAGFAPEGSWAAVSTLGITGTITLFTVSYFAQNLIGFIYVDRTKEHIRISYLDFWGRRKNVEMRADEMEPPSEKLRLGFFSMVNTKNKESYKLLRKMGEVGDPDVFAHFFGE